MKRYIIVVFGSLYVSLICGQSLQEINNTEMKMEFQIILDRVKSIGGETKNFIFDKPATENELLEIEKELNHRIPEEFRNVLLMKSSHCEISWFLPNEFELPIELEEIFSGNLHWGTEFIVKFNRDKEDWINEVFPNSENEYDKIWHNKFVFQEVGNGDYLGIDMNEKDLGKIIYLSHDDGEGHGYVLANSFNELLSNWSQIGFVGAEDWQWLPFVESKVSGILPNCAKAKAWKELIKMN